MIGPATATAKRRRTRAPKPPPFGPASSCNNSTSGEVGLDTRIRPIHPSRQRRRGSCPVLRGALGDKGCATFPYADRADERVAGRQGTRATESGGRRACQPAHGSRSSPRRRSRHGSDGSSSSTVAGPRRGHDQAVNTPIPVGVIGGEENMVMPARPSWSSSRSCPEKSRGTRLLPSRESAISARLTACSSDGASAVAILGAIEKTIASCKSSFCGAIRPRPR